MTTAEQPTGARDPYARVTELDAAMVATLAERFEIRAADPHQQRLWDDFLARLPPVPRARVLEIGCGTGIITAKIAKLPGVGEAVGVDPSPGFIDRARTRMPSLQFEVADGRELPFADETFDGVIFATTLCHIPAPELAIAEARRILRAGGFLLIYDGDYATATVALGDNDPLQTCVAAAVAALVNDPWLVRRIERLLRDTGFHPGDLHSHGYLEGKSSAYMSSLIDFGADTLAERGAISPATASALKAEARHRAETGQFFGHIAYASLLAHRTHSSTQ